MNPLQETSCRECGMDVREGEFHPYAACLMYKACGDPRTVRENLRYLREDTERLDWLLSNMGKKGFDDKACGIVDRADIDAAIYQENAKPAQ